MSALIFLVFLSTFRAVRDRDLVEQYSEAWFENWLAALAPTNPNLNRVRIRLPHSRAAVKEGSMWYAFVSGSGAQTAVPGQPRTANRYTLAVADAARDRAARCAPIKGPSLGACAGCSGGDVPVVAMCSACRAVSHELLGGPPLWSLSSRFLPFSQLWRNNLGAAGIPTWIFWEMRPDIRAFELRVLRSFDPETEPDAGDSWCVGWCWREGVVMLCIRYF